MARRRGLWRVLVTLLVLLGLALSALLLFNNRVLGAGTLSRVTIPDGANLRILADSLRSARAIRSALVLRVVATIRGRSGVTFRGGRYFVRRGASASELLEQFETGRGRYHRLTIPEGWGIRQIATLMSDSLGIDTSAFRAVTRDSIRRARMRTSAADLEGYLFPATYEIRDQSTPAAIVDTMLITFERRWKSSWDSTLQATGRTRHDLVTLASIVEKEAGRSSDRPLIAAVYRNRLQRGLRLQADPTVLYAMGLIAKRVMYADLRVVSPYNTYRVSGLPPGPIASPGTASLAAAMFPADSNVMFFVAFPDGHSQFTTTFGQHRTAVKASRAARDSAAKR